ncbi:hypothetical protein D9M71_307010 [compost metagenome]
MAQQLPAPLQPPPAGHSCSDPPAKRGRIPAVWLRHFRRLHTPTGRALLQRIIRERGKDSGCAPWSLQHLHTLTSRALLQRIIRERGKDSGCSAQLLPALLQPPPIGHSCSYSPAKGGRIPAVWLKGFRRLYSPTQGTSAATHQRKGEGFRLYGRGLSAPLQPRRPDTPAVAHQRKGEGFRLSL